MFIAKTIKDIRSFIKYHKASNCKISFIPTMGALHDGHLSLIQEGQKLSDITIASIFVNPKQFAANEDLDTYPKTLETDLKKLKEIGCDAVFIPSVDDMYPDDFSFAVNVTSNHDILCGVARPHFFHGVVTVVLKLFNIITPDFAIFGEKDYQQFYIIRKLISDFNLDISIIAGEIIREKDGLAMSSRNKYLNQEERKIAPQLYQELNILARNIATTKKTKDECIAEAKENLIKAGFDKVDYIEMRSSINLRLQDKADNDSRLFAAVYMGKTRLIDNIKICKND